MLGLGLDLTARGVLQGGAPAAPAWTPLDLGASLKAWWNADDHGTARMVDDGAGLISSWTDSKGAMAVTAATTARPTWSATSFNSAYAGLTFDGVATCMVSTTLTTLPTGAVAGEEWALVSQSSLPADATLKCIVRYGTGTGAADRSLNRVGSVTNRVRLSDGSGNLTDTLVDFSGPHIAGGFWSGTTMAGRVDGAAISPASAVIATLATGTARLRIGATNGAAAGFFLLGVVRHVLVTTTLTAGEREQIEGWMAHTSGLTSVLPGGHPYKSAAP